MVDRDVMLKNKIYLERIVLCYKFSILHSSLIDPSIYIYIFVCIHLNQVLKLHAVLHTEMGDRNNKIIVFLASFLRPFFPMPRFPFLLSQANFKDGTVEMLKLAQCCRYRCRT